MSLPIKNRIGIRYSYLVVIKLAYQDYNNTTFWLCKCDCGKEKIVRGDCLQSGNTKSCGCFSKEASSKRMKKLKGKNNYNYTEGKFTEETFKLKEEKRRQNNYTCQECGVTQEKYKNKYNKKLSVHHIDRDDTNNVEENMITFCQSCHKKIESNKKIK